MFLVVARDLGICLDAYREDSQSVSISFLLTSCSLDSWAHVVWQHGPLEWHHHGASLFCSGVSLVILLTWSATIFSLFKIKSYGTY